jgi:hypothetical protein
MFPIVGLEDLLMKDDGYDGQMDIECIKICNALNKIRGIQTINSCCGHGKHGFWIFFTTKSFIALSKVCYFADKCHSGVSNWQVIAYTDCSMTPNRFLLEGPTDDYAGADKIADTILGK